METKLVKIETPTLEFLLDLPDDASIVGIRFEGDVVHLELKTAIAFPQNSTLIYKSDGNGSLSLVGSE